MTDRKDDDLAPWAPFVDAHRRLPVAAPVEEDTSSSLPAGAGSRSGAGVTPMMAPRIRRPMPADLRARVVTGVGVAVGAALVLRAGPLAVAWLAAAVVVAAVLELYAASRAQGHRPAILLGVIASGSLVLGAYDRGPEAFPLILALSVVFGLVWYVIDTARNRPAVDLSVTLLGVVYVGGLGAFGGLLVGLDDGVGMVVGLALCAVAHDVGAYFVGARYGRRRIAPRLSPNKSIEGLAAGMAASLVAGGLLAARVAPWDLKTGLALGALVAVLAPLGDLCESMVKRDLAVKDLGTVLPGHGGVLDRFDTILFALPGVYYLARGLGLG
ncbi:MAG: phosphatidate cytidylyltransferase [Acidimicrobiia bacterium]